MTRTTSSRRAMVGSFAFACGVVLVAEIGVRLWMRPDRRTHAGAGDLYDMWAVTLGMVLGCSAIACRSALATFRGPLSDIARGSVRPLMATALATTCSLVAVIIAGLIMSGPGVNRALRAAAAGRTAPIVVATVVLVLPSLSLFAALRFTASAEREQTDGGLSEYAVIIQLRSTCHRWLIALAGLLVLAVISLDRRRAVLAVGGSTPKSARLDANAVAVFGVAFAVMLGACSLAATRAIDDRARSLVDDAVPLFGDDSHDAGHQFARRRELSEALGLSASVRVVEAGFVIVAPIITALLTGALQH